MSQPKRGRGRPRKSDQVNSSSSPSQSKPEVQATRVFYENLDSQNKVLVNRGSAGSSKSYSIAQWHGHKFFTEENKKFLIIRKTLPSLRISVLLLWYEILASFGARDQVQEEKVPLNYWYGSNFLHFGGFDDPEKIKSTDWNYIWMEEATEFSYDDYKQLKLRLRSPSRDGKRNQLVLSFNPIDEYHWIKEKVVDDKHEDVKEIHSTYKDNPFLDDDYVQTLQNLENQDPMFYRIYALGLWGRLENLIYQFGIHWDTIDFWPTDANDDNIIYGLDFGFNAETALTQHVLKPKDIFSRELLYEKKLTNPELIEKMNHIFPTYDAKRKARIYADSAEPDRIEEIYKAGYRNVRAADKQVLDGIDRVKNYRVHIHNASTNLIKEKRSYSWRKDRSGRILDEPIDFMNHAQDAERYAIYSHLRRGGNLRIRAVG